MNETEANFLILCTYFQYEWAKSKDGTQPSYVGLAINKLDKQMQLDKAEM